MKVQEEFIVEQAPTALWAFFEQVDRVARCVPGVEAVEVVDADNSRVRVTQAVGPMTATFDMKMRITARDPGRSMEFTAIGRSVRGAAGNVRSTNTVHLEEADDGSTRVRLEGDVALGGMLGSVGQKVVAKQASKVTRSFAEALQLELSGGAASAPDPGSADGETVSPPPAASEPAAASLPRPALAEPVLPVPHAGPRLPGATVRTVTAGALVLAVAAFALRRLRGR